MLSGLFLYSETCVGPWSAEAYYHLLQLYFQDETRDEVHFSRDPVSASATFECFELQRRSKMMGFGVLKTTSLETHAAWSHRANVGSSQKPMNIQKPKIALKIFSTELNN